jgi:Mn2+/Fe2+ NRAMP family transporter
MYKKLRGQFAQLGPGLLYAGAAIGVSHLVQSTRAGAEFGFSLVWVIILTNLVKYPIFEMGARYVAATGQTLLDGYKKIGRWVVALYVLMTVSTMFIILAAITLVTAGLLYQLTGVSLDAKLLGVILLVGSTFILIVGKYSALDKLMKFIVVMLTFCTIVALSFAIIEPVNTRPEFLTYFDFSNTSHVLFIVALIGWMPAPLDIVVWHSLWSASKNKEQGSVTSLRVSLLDFRLGYWGTTVLSVAFLSLGALMMYGSGTQLSSSAVGFSEQLLKLYIYNIGQWAFPFIAIAAFTTMLSTLLTCLDAFPRSLRKSTKLLFPRFDKKKFHRVLYRNWIFLTVFGTVVTLFYFSHDMRALVDFATTTSFVLAPIFAIFNYLAMNDKGISSAFRQPTWLRLSSLGSIAILVIFSIWFLIY